VKKVLYIVSNIFPTILHTCLLHQSFASRFLWKPVEKIQIWLQSGSLREDLSTYTVAGDIKLSFNAVFY